MALSWPFGSLTWLGAAWILRSGRNGSGLTLTRSDVRPAMTPHIGQSDADDLSGVSGWR
jgi:hypothetical protein